MFFIFFCASGEKAGEKAAGRLGWLKMGKPRGAGQMRSAHLLDKWFKGRLGGVCCREWLGSRVMGGLFCVNGCWSMGGGEYVWERKT